MFVVFRSHGAHRRVGAGGGGWRLCQGRRQDGRLLQQEGRQVYYNLVPNKNTQDTIEDNVAPTPN